VLLAWGFVKPVLLLTADVVLHGTSSDEGFLLLLIFYFQGASALASMEPRDAYYVYPIPIDKVQATKSVSSITLYVLVIRTVIRNCRYAGI